MEKKSEQKREKGSPGCLCGLTVVIVVQCLTLVCVHLWQEWRLDNFRSNISEKGELLTFLESECDVETGQSQYHEHSRVRRQLMGNFLKDFLAQQQQALLTVCVRRPDLCIPGPQGLTGETGPAGLKGDPGVDGVTGMKGAQGAVGVTGDKGNTGLKGAKGAAGSPGAAGPAGIKGAAGAVGDRGAKGDTGPRGDTGTAGAPGPRGIAGTKGATGSKGMRGLPGAKGDRGDRGLPGPKGLPGIRGLDGKLLHSECFCLDEIKIQGNFSQTVHVPFGAPMSLHCEFNMMNIPVTWTKDGGPISNRGQVIGHDLVFEQVIESDGGRYHCSGPDGLLGYVSKSVNVVVGAKSMYDCDFETTCSWTEATDDKIDWTRRHGTTPTLNTGPTHDHTFQNSSGNYMYIETSSSKMGDNAVLQSKLLSAHHHFCLTFWYHMYGTTVDTLEVRLKSPQGTGSPIWSQKGTHGNKWLMAKVDLAPQNTNYYVLLNAITGLSYTGDIAIDDIIFLDGACP